MSERPSVNIVIDDKPISVPKGTTVYQAAAQNGIDIPIFCYQDRMPPFGACRMCLVEVEKAGKLQASCTLEATEGMVVRTQSNPAVQGRKEIIEFLLINHPLDCPICDRAGECPLQDNTMENGSGKSRFYEEKRHFPKPLALSPVLMLDRERCIICARCTRFSDLISGDNALELIDRGYRSEVGTPHGDWAKSKFIGNTIMLCPVGALTSRVYRFRARPWDNEPTATTCTLCPVGCSMILDSRDGEVMRTRSCENKAVNDIWMCDKGWFGYEFSEHKERLQHPLIRKNGKLEQASWEEALSLISWKLHEAKNSGLIAGWGGSTLTSEENFLFQKLIREGLKSNHLDHRIGKTIISTEQEGIAPGMEITPGECEQLSFVVLVGLDLTEEFPVLWLRIKQAINCGAKVISIGHYALEVAQHLSKNIVCAPGEELEHFKALLPELSQQAANGSKGTIFVGRQILASNQRLPFLSEALKFRRSNPNISLNVMEGSGNSMGARWAGMHPEYGPMGRKLSQTGLDAAQLVDRAAAGGWGVLYIAGANPALTFPKEQWNQARSMINFMVVHDLFLTETAKQADVVLPTLCFTEKRGTMINIEGRVQKIQPGMQPAETLYSDGEIFTLLGQKLLFPLTLDRAFSDSMKVEKIPLPRPQEITSFLQGEINLSGDLSASFAPALFDRGTRMKYNTRLGQMSPQPKIRLNTSEGEKRGLKSGDRISVRSASGTAEGTLILDKRVAEKTVVLPVGFDEFDAYAVSPQLWNGTPVEIMVTV